MLALFVKIPTQFLRGFQILCESHFANPLAISPLVRTLQLAAAAIGKLL